MYVKIEHENSTAGCVQSVILLKCSRKVRIGTNILKNTPVSNWTASSLYHFFEVFFFKLKLKQMQCVSFMIFLEFFSGGGSLTVKSCQVLCPFHSIVEIESGHKTKVFSFSPTASSF